MKEIKGQLKAGEGKYAIVVSRFNEFITSRLLAGAVDCLKRHGAADESDQIRRQIRRPAGRRADLFHRHQNDFQNSVQLQLL